MTRTPTPDTIRRYREMILTNPDTYQEQLQAAYEELRRRGESLYMNRDLVEADEHITEEQQEAELDALDNLIGQIGGRLDLIKQSLDDFKNDQQNLMTLGRKARRTASKDLRTKRVRTLRDIQVAPEPTEIEPPAEATEALSEAGEQNEEDGNAEQV